jgi:hypothetical protein
MNIMNKEDLLKMIEDDDLGLLSIKPVNSSIMTADERLVSSFQEINDFFLKEGREPVSGGNIREHQIATRLKSLREDSAKAASLSEYDEFGLLKTEQKIITSLEDIFQDDELGLLDKTDESLFQIEHVPVIVPEREDPDFIARRRPCVDFDQYEPLFHECHKELASGTRKLIPFVESQMSAGDFFVLDGVLLLLVRIYDPYRGNSNKINRRTYCIFENGTESNALLRSLGKGLSENGFAVSAGQEGKKGSLFEASQDVIDEDIKTGFIYILKSLTKDEKIQGLGNVYKIGFSNIPVEERIKNAVNEPTYLMAPVSIVSTFECYNFNPQKLEQLLHNFFGSACLNVDIFDMKNQRHSPREWFVAPLPVIEKSIELIISGSIVNYKYDANRERIVLRSFSEEKRD